MWEARFQPGWIWFLRICVHRKRGRTPDESCLSKLHCGTGTGTVGFVKLWVLQGAIQYSVCRPRWKREKKLWWLKHVLLPWVVYYCGRRFSSRDASPISISQSLSSRIRNMDLVCSESSEVSGSEAQTSEHSVSSERQRAFHIM